MELKSKKFGSTVDAQRDERKRPRGASVRQSVRDKRMRWVFCDPARNNTRKMEYISVKRFFLLSFFLVVPSFYFCLVITFLFWFFGCNVPNQHERWVIFTLSNVPSFHTRGGLMMGPMCRPHSSCERREHCSGRT